MSAFLGPIHHWLFRKIHFQNDMTNKIVEFCELRDGSLRLREKLRQQYGELEHTPLEKIIDSANIHGWLQKRVVMVESRLADAVTSVLKKDKGLMPELEKLAFTFGKENTMTEITGAKNWFSFLNNVLLDGMPCDHANEVLSQDSEEVTWKRNLCVHKDYWDAAGGNIDNYYTLRDALIKGILNGSGYGYQKLEDSTYKIKKAV